MNDLEIISAQLLELALTKGVMLSIAESCTGGMVSTAITSIPGSSKVFDRGFITYSYESKTEMLGVPNDVLLRSGAVSEKVAELMATGALKNSRAQLSLAITGIAGPDGGTENKPVGLVCFATNFNGKVTRTRQVFTGNRQEIRKQASLFALQMLKAQLEIS